MSLQRSVEARTTAEAMELALARYGDGAEVLEVRTVRSGGLLGFFTNERVRVMIGDGPEDDGGPEDTASGVAPEVLDVAADPVDEVTALFGAPADPGHVPDLMRVPASAGDPLPDPGLYVRPTTIRLPAPPSPATQKNPVPLDARRTDVLAANTLAASQSSFAAALARITGEDPVVAAAVKRSSRTSTPPADLDTDHAGRAAGRHRAESSPRAAGDADPSDADLSDADLSDADLSDVRTGARVFAPAPTNMQAGTQAMALHELGLPASLVTPSLLADMAENGPHAAFTWLFRQRIASAPSAPNEAGQVLLVLGPGAEALHGAGEVARLVGVDPATIMFTTASRDLARLVTIRQRVQTVTEATARAVSTKAGMTPVIVAVDAPLGPTSTVANQMIQAWDPDGVWAVVDATRRASDLTRWLGGFTIVDALIGHGVETSTVPGGLLSTGIPVALLDGRTATPKRWASVLCERLDGEDE